MALPNPQPELPGLAGSDGSEPRDIACHELAELQSRLASEGRVITMLEVLRKGGYRVTVKRQYRWDGLLRGHQPLRGESEAARTSPVAAFREKPVPVAQK